MSESSHDRASCIFCKICDGKEPNNIIYQDEDYVVFPDIKPAAPHHYLVIPREHYTDVKNISSNKITMVERMVEIGKEVLIEQGGTIDHLRLGFHWPPFHSISHLHLHVIAPEQEMGLIARGIFKTNSFWFVTPETAIQKLKEKGS